MQTNKGSHPMSIEVTFNLQAAVDEIQRLNEASLQRTERMLSDVRDLRLKLEAWMEETEDSD